MQQSMRTKYNSNAETLTLVPLERRPDPEPILRDFSTRHCRSIQTDPDKFHDLFTFEKVPRKGRGTFEKSTNHET